MATEETEKTYTEVDLQRFFEAYFDTLKQGGEDYNYRRVNTAFFNAIDTLDKKYRCADFAERAKKNFEKIASHLDRIARDLYKDEQESNGIYNQYSNPEKTYTVAECAPIIGISEQAIRKAIKEERLTAIKGGKNGGYLITENSLKEFNKNRKRK